MFDRKKWWKEYYLKNKEAVKEKNKKWYWNNKEARDKQNKNWYWNNKERHNQKCKENYLKNIEHVTERMKKHNSKPETKERVRKNWKKRYYTDVNFKLRGILRCRIAGALKGRNKSASTMQLIGCTINELKKHLESKFEPWMNWENQGRGGWDIDHIIAMSKFDLSCPVQQHACCHYSNLQPLGHADNIKKGNK
mgnify:FL=1